MKTTWLLFLLVLLGACEKTQKNYVLQVKVQQLYPEGIYLKDLVYDIVFNAQEQDVDSLQTASRQLFLQAIDQYKNKKQLEKAIVLFKKSILVFPAAKTYYELGNALLESGRWPDEALQAYDVAQHLQFEPASEILFNKARVHAQLHRRAADEETRQAVWQNLDAAFAAGFADTLSLYRDPNLRALSNTDQFRNLLISVKTSSLQNKPQGLFGLFQRSFPVVQQPFEIPLPDVAMAAYRQSISYDFARFIPEMQNASFGRDVSHDYFYVAKVAQTPQYVALVYSSVNFMGEDMQPVLTKLVTFDNQGKPLGSLLISCQCSAEKVKKARLADGLITLEDFKRVWKHPIDEVPFDKNVVTKYESLATATYRIEATGKIVEEAVPADYNSKGVLALGKE